MSSFRETKTLPYHPEFLFDIVMDIRAYPEFLPWCTNASIVMQDHHKTIADLTVNFKGFTHEYRSQVVAHPKSLITTESISGIFKYLKSSWSFYPQQNGQSCLVEFYIDFEFKSLLLNSLASLVWNKASQNMIAAFEARAASIYI